MGKTAVDQERLREFEKKRKDIIEKSDNDVNKMATAPVGKLLASMSWPAVLSMTIGALYNMVDSMFVSRLQAGSHALTSVSIVMPIQMMMVALAVGSGVGANSLIARRLGAKRFEEADKAASTSLFIALFNGLIFLLVGLFLAEPFVSAYTDDPLIHRYAVSYFRIVTILSVFFMIECQLEKVLQSTGNMIAPMITSTTGAVTNIILDPILIFGLFGAPKMEVAGAAAATVIGQAAAMVLALVIAFTKEHDVKFQIKGFKVDWSVVKDIYVVGLPSILMQSIGSFMLIGYNRIIASSDVAVAVLGVYYKLESFIFMPVFGMTQGAMPIIGYNYGSRNRERLMKTFKTGLAAALCMMGIGFVLFQLFPGWMLGLFNADSEMMSMGVPALRRISWCFLPAAFGIMCSTVFQATGHGVYSLMASLIRQLIGILPLAYILYHMSGVTASWYSFPLAEILGFVYSAVMMKHLYKKEIAQL
ncbi:MAG: MATE family efflux transporter [Anaerovoracaceae bacterium]